ncbi:MAG: hypothetical protein AABY22_32765 [Nanoarchaeota archaeon]
MIDEEFNLSSKEKYLGTGLNEDDCIYKKKDVKEFLYRLKDYIKHKCIYPPQTSVNLFKEINKLAGDKLR